MNAFLMSLPAVLGIVGFVIYLILKKSITADPIIKSILNKLKHDEPQFYKHLQQLSESERAQLIAKDNEFKAKISEGDRLIINRIVINQFRTNIFVYSLCAALLVAGLVLFLRPKPLNIDSIQLQNANAFNNDLITDLDPITVTWTSTGSDGPLYVVLANAATGKQSNRIPVQASVGKIKFVVDKYSNFDKILSDREPNGSNRIKAILYSGKESFQSTEFEVKVGIKIIAYEERPNLIRFNALIDQVIVENFLFAPRLALFKDEHFHGQHVFEAERYMAEPCIVVQNPKDYTPANLVININPQDVMDSKLIRTDVPAIRDAILALKFPQQKN
jgi:hypothetical protein